METLIKNQKIVIIGLGEVGKSVAYSIVNQGICNELVLINRTEEKAKAYALDLMHCLRFLPHNIKIRSGNYDDCSDATIIILCAAGASLKGKTDRNEVLLNSCDTIQPIVENVKKSGFNGFYLVLTNPADTISYFVWKTSGLSSSHVLSTGTSLDSARLCFYLCHIMSISPKYINAFCLGEHGQAQFIPWSCVNVYGKPIDQIIAEKKYNFPDNFKEFITNKVINSAFKIIQSVGSTSFGVASAATYVAKQIIYDEKSIVPVSTNLRGYYGIDEDIFMSVPCVIDASGVRNILSLNLDEEDSESLRKCVDILRNYKEQVNEKYHF